MRGEFEEQQRQALRGAGADHDIRTIDGNAIGMRNRAGFEQTLEADALPLAFAQQ